MTFVPECYIANITNMQVLELNKLEAAHLKAASSLAIGGGAEGAEIEIDEQADRPVLSIPEDKPKSRIWKIRLTLTAKAMLLKITDRRIATKLVEIIDGLKIDPDRQGAPLVEDLLGYRKLRAVGQRYRVIYTLDDSTNAVFVVAIGIRKEGSKDDIYELAKKLLRRGLLTPSDEDYKALKRDDDVQEIKLR